MITAEIEVLDNDICKDCKLLYVVNYPTELYGGSAVIAIENHYKCDHVNQCRYLRNLFGSASKTPPKIEGEKDAP